MLESICIGKNAAAASGRAKGDAYEPGWSELDWSSALSVIDIGSCDIAVDGTADCIEVLENMPRVSQEGFL